MPAIATSKFRVHNAQQFLEAFSEAADTKMYFYIGGVSGFVDDSNPPTPTNDTSSIEYSPWQDMIAAKRVQSTEVVQVIDRYNWATGVVYDQYDDQDADILDDNFYVMTADYNVYKCLWNNGAISSTVEPTGTSNSPFETADLYVWKYMYTVSTADALKFLTNEFMPVRTDTTVSTNAIDGGIHQIIVTAAGSAYSTAPTVTITGDGTGATATATTDTNLITKIVMDTVGTGYTQATATITGGGGTGATCRIIISPKGGHGADAPEELGGKFVMLNVRLDGTEDGTISVANDFRKVGLVRDPYTYGTTDIETTTNIRQTFKYVLTGVTGIFAPDDTVTVGTSTATVVEYDAGTLSLYTTMPYPSIAAFAGASTINSDNATPGGATIDSVVTPGLQPHSGDVLYIENRSPISRATDQIEDIKLIVEF
jgi:hypothetical protein